MYKGDSGLQYDDFTKRYLNISAEYDIESHDEFHNRTFVTNFTKNVRQCNRTDFDQVEMGEDFDAMSLNINFLLCIDDFKNVILARTQDGLYSRNFILRFNECDPLNN